MNKQRRNLIKGALATTAATAFVAGYSPKVKEIAKGVIEGSSGQKTQDNINGNSLLPEYQVKEGNLLTNSQQVVCNTQCMGCWTLCGLRVRIDLEKIKYCVLTVILITRSHQIITLIIINQLNKQS